MFLKKVLTTTPTFLSLMKQRVSDTILKVSLFHLEKHFDRNFLEGFKETFYQSLSQVLTNGMFCF